MAQDKKIIIGNWKMNLNIHDSSILIHKLLEEVESHRNVEVVIAPTMLALQTLSVQTNRRKIKLAAQNFYWRDFGAFTGEVSATQLNGVVSYGLVGHSERRHVFGEKNKETGLKVQAALRNRITPVLCVGETVSERSNGETDETLDDQVSAGMSNVTSDEAEKVIVAYEPVWAIGTGNSAIPHDVEDAIKTIKRSLSHLFGKEVASKVKVLYGGSVTMDSAPDYLRTEGVDGLLIGGASLKAYDFSQICKRAHEIAAE